MRLAKELDSKLFKEFARNYYHATLPKDLIKTIVLFYGNGGCMEYEPREFFIPLEYLAFTLL